MTTPPYGSQQPPQPPPTFWPNQPGWSQPQQAPPQPQAAWTPPMGAVGGVPVRPDPKQRWYKRLSREGWTAVAVAGVAALVIGLALGATAASNGSGTDGNMAAVATPDPREADLDEREAAVAEREAVAGNRDQELAAREDAISKLQAELVDQEAELEAREAALQEQPEPSEAAVPAQAPAQSQAPGKAPAPAPVDPAPQTQAPPAADTTYYKNCDAVRAAGKAPIRKGEPGYAPHLDRDNDGIGCE